MRLKRFIFVGFTALSGRPVYALRSLKGTFGGFTVSLDGGIEEVEEFLRNAANWALSSAMVASITSM